MTPRRFLFIIAAALVSAASAPNQLRAVYMVNRDGATVTIERASVK